MVGCCVARLLLAIPDAQVTLVDIDPARAELAAALGVDFALPDAAPGDQDVVFHASTTAAGLQRAIDALAFEGTVIELSWYGDAVVPIMLGGAFHSQRLTIRASQVGAVAPAKRGTVSLADRRAAAIRLLRDPAFDALLSGPAPFAELPDVLARLADGSLPALCHTISYDEE
jgi:threonine dehydrogenase-like Zn-dependent dehydrogenase